MENKVSNQATRIAEHCSDAFSSNRYQSWEEVAYRLLNMGLDERQVEAVMRSKWARWAADKVGAGEGSNSAPASALYEFVKAECRKDRYAVERLTAETFGETFRAPRREAMQSLTKAGDERGTVSRIVAVKEMAKALRKLADDLEADKGLEIHVTVFDGAMAVQEDWTTEVKA